MLIEKSFHTGILEINYAEVPGAGPPMVLLHGLPGRWQEFLPVLPALGSQWHLYALDCRGQGASGRVPGGYQAKYYFDDLVKFLEGVLDEPAILFGLSAGGIAALSAAAQRPELVRALILGDSPVDMEMLLGWMRSEGFQKLFSAYRALAGLDLSVMELAEEIADIPVQVPGTDQEIRYGDQPGMDAIQILGMATTLKQMDPGVLEYHAEGRVGEFFEGFDLDQVLGDIRMPLLLLQADPELGAMTTDKSIRYVQSMVPDVVHVRIEGAGHDLGFDAWEVGAVLRVVTGFAEAV